MKNTFIFLVIFFLLNSHLKSQSCLTYDIIFTTQEEIDNFQINYPNITEIEVNVYIGSLDGPSDINNLEGLSVITSIEQGLLILKNPNLHNLSGLNNLSSVFGLHIYNNDSLVDLSALNGITSNQSILSISSNTLLSSLEGLGGLYSVGYEIKISNNPSLSNIEALSGIHSAPYVKIENCPALTSLNGLDNISFIDGLRVINLDGITNLSGLGGLTTIGSYAYIEECNSLVDFSGLDNFEGFPYGGFLTIRDNNLVTDISALENCDLGVSLYIENNNLLSECAIQSICDRLNNPWGSIEISNNATGCNSPEEVEEACDEVGISQKQNSPYISFYPNPVDNEIFIQTNEEIKFKAIHIYNPKGQLVLSKNDGFEKINVSILNQGFYIIEFLTENFTYRDKFIAK